MNFWALLLASLNDFIRAFIMIMIRIEWIKLILILKFLGLFFIIDILGISNLILLKEYSFLRSSMLQLWKLFLLL